MVLGLNVPAGRVGCRLFEPIDHWLVRCQTLPGLDELNHLADTVGRPCTGGGAPIRFVPAGEVSSSYEQHVFSTGQVPCRADNWHDFYNALMWLTFPRTKAALNARHLRHLRTGPRGPVRDAATQFDECGVVVVHAHLELAAALQAHEWQHAFWDQREALSAHTRFLVFGHALYERLGAPHVGLCGKAVYLEVAQAVVDAPVAVHVEVADERLSQAFARDDFCMRPGAFSALPLLGIPGMTADNACAAYYQDTRQFRPRPSRA